MTVLLRLCAILFGLGPFLQTARADEQRLVMPREIVLYVQQDLPETGFVDPLVCALERVLTAPISVKTSNVPIGSDLLLRGQQYDVDAIAALFSARTAGENGPAFRHLIVRQDVVSRNFNFLFASRFGDGPVPERIQIASTARLRGGLAGKTGGIVSDALAARLYKIILRGVVHGAGYPGQGCVLAYTNTYLDFDTKTLELCPEDKARLIKAGLVREEERTECAPSVAWHRGRNRLATSLPMR